MKKIRRRWTDKVFQAELCETIRVLGHFPSHSDLLSLGRGDLSKQIRRHGGFLACADQMGCPRKWSDSDTGWNGENQAAAQLRSLGFQVVARSGVKCPFDLLVDGVLRIDVKAARLHRYKSVEGWFYRIGKHPQSDVILLWQLDTGHFYAIPWFKCPTSSVTISKSGGKYRSFFNNADLIRRMIQRRIDEWDELQSLIGTQTDRTSQPIPTAGTDAFHNAAVL